MDNSFWENTVTTCESCVGDGVLTCDGTTGTEETCIVDNYYKDTLATWRDCALYTGVVVATCNLTDGIPLTCTSKNYLITAKTCAPNDINRCSI